MRATDLLKLIAENSKSKSVPGELGKQSYQNDNTPTNHVDGKKMKQVNAPGGGEKKDKKSSANPGTPKKRERRSMEGPGKAAKRLSEASAKDIQGYLLGSGRDSSTGVQFITMHDINRGQEIQVPLSDPRTYRALLTAIKSGDDSLATRAYSQLINSPDAQFSGSSFKGKEAGAFEKGSGGGSPSKTFQKGKEADPEKASGSKTYMRGGTNVYRGDSEAAKRAASSLSLADSKGNRIRESGAERSDSMGKEKAAAGGPVSKSATVKTAAVDKKPSADVGKVKGKEKRNMGENPAPVKDFKGGENEHRSMRKMHEAISELENWLGSDLHLLEGDDSLLSLHGLDSDQPTTCPKCGNRTDFSDNPDGSQKHKCLNKRCGYEFRGEFDEATGCSSKKKVAESVSPNTVLQHYLEAAFWTEKEELDSKDFSDLAPEALQRAKSDVQAFIQAAGSLLDQLDDKQTGHDFWLTRNGHGAGFWDRGLGEVGEKLSELSDKAGQVDLYAGDDGKLYFA